MTIPESPVESMRVAGPPHSEMNDLALYHAGPLLWFNMLYKPDLTLELLFRVGI